MVDSGQKLQRDPHTALPRFGFAPGGIRQPTGIEVLSLEDVRTRFPGIATAHRVDFHQVMVVTAGVVELSVDLTEYRLAKGSTAWVRPGQVQRIDGPEADAVLVLFQDAAIGGLPGLTGVLDRPGVPAVSKSDNLVMTLVSLLHTECRSDGADGAIPGHLLAALILAVDRSATARARPLDDTATAFLVAVETHYMEPGWAVAHYAREIGCSSRTLTRTCRAGFGLSPKEVIDRRRVLEAKRLLVYTDLTVQTIGARVGIPDPSLFVKVFKRVEGSTTPGSLRAQSRITFRATEDTD